jgi:hypothetical protein
VRYSVGCARTFSVKKAFHRRERIAAEFALAQ